MRAMQMNTFREPLVLVGAPIIAPRPDGALIRVEACGICRSDWHLWNQDMELKLPAIPDHEVGGVVAEVGRDVKNIKVGDRVTIPLHESDGTCPQCRDGLPNLCDNMISPPQGRPGGWAEYVTVVHADFNCIKLPDEVEALSAAALGCRFMTSYHAVIGRGQARG
jgi:propanol-preferring alcohol dehydrogenase